MKIDGEKHFAVLWIPLLMRGKSDGTLVAVFNLQQLLETQLPPFLLDDVDIAIYHESSLIYTNHQGTDPYAYSSPLPIFSDYPFTIYLWLSHSLQKQQQFTLPKILLSFGIVFSLFTAILVYLLSNARRRSQELEQANRAKMSFLSNVSHEVRTPLHGILATSSLLQAFTMPEKEHKLVQIINASGKRLLELMDNLLELSKLESNAVKTQISLFNLDALLDELIHQFDPLAREKGLTFSLRLQERAPIMLKTDRSKLRQILEQLIANSLKFTETGGIEIYKYLCEDFVCMDIIDTGSGIPADKQSQLFEHFCQIDDPYTKTVGGLGIGLSLSRRLALTLNGQITFTSTLGKGSTFTVRLPYTF